MIKVIKEGNVQVKCKNCNSVLSLDHVDAVEKNTSPPTWKVECPVCFTDVSLTCANGVGALISQHIHMDPEGAIEYSTAARIWGIDRARDILLKKS